MSSDAAHSKTVETIAMLATVALLVTAVVVRGLHGAPPLAPQDRPREKTEFAEPMQLLGRGASLRIEELTARVSETVKPNWKAAHRLPFELRDCPKLLEWIESADGQRFERLLGELRRGSREDAFASLALTLALARATDWNPGLLARTQNAERLGALLQQWLSAWGERGVGDSLLAEPTLAATVLYGRVMRIAAEAPPLGRFDAPYERAKAFLANALLDNQGQATALGRALQARFPAASSGFTDEHDCLAGFDREGAQVFAGLDGKCSQ
jgi:hypothetical protein